MQDDHLLTNYVELRNPANQRETAKLSMGCENLHKIIYLTRSMYGAKLLGGAIPSCGMQDIISAGMRLVFDVCAIRTKPC
jgi:hypothetical protein